MTREDLKEFFSRYVYPFSGGSGHLTGNIDPEVIEDGANECVKIAEQYANQFKPKWIPVTEPPESGDLCNIKKGKAVNIACYSKMDNSWYGNDADGKTIEYTGITHYCKLPEL